MPAARFKYITIYSCYHQIVIYMKITSKETYKVVRAVLENRKFKQYQISKKENIGKDKIQVHLSSCISFDSHHGGACPHKKYLKSLICDKSGLDCTEGSRISDLTEKRREEGLYKKTVLSKIL